MTNMTIYSGVTRVFKATRFDYRYYKARFNPPESELTFMRRMGWRYWWYSFNHQYREWIIINKRLKRIRLDFAVFYHGRKINIEVDGRQHEQRVVDDWQRDEGLRERGWEILRIKTGELNDPQLVRRVVRKIRRGS